MTVYLDPMNSVAHHTLGNVYAVLTQYNKSIESFDYATFQQSHGWKRCVPLFW